MPHDKQQYKKRYLLRKIEEKESEKLIGEETREVVGGPQEDEVALPRVWKPD